MQELKVENHESGKLLHGHICIYKHKLLSLRRSLKFDNRQVLFDKPYSEHTYRKVLRNLTKGYKTFNKTNFVIVMLDFNTTFGFF